ncbi:MAG: tetratricopeptide repeat protein [Candidatus Lokiarchaeota archaeon]|nr:tetratricopeptide repeat protein [Candidatus Lokiarchaeota archaeon]
MGMNPSHGIKLAAVVLISFIFGRSRKKLEKYLELQFEEKSEVPIEEPMKEFDWEPSKVIDLVEESGNFLVSADTKVIFHRDKAARSLEREIRDGPVVQVDDMVDRMNLPKNVILNLAEALPDAAIKANAVIYSERILRSRILNELKENGMVEISAIAGKQIEEDDIRWLLDNERLQLLFHDGKIRNMRKEIEEIRSWLDQARILEIEEVSDKTGIPKDALYKYVQSHAGNDIMSFWRPPIFVSQSWIENVRTELQEEPKGKIADLAEKHSVSTKSLEFLLDRIFNARVTKEDFDYTPQPEAFIKESRRPRRTRRRIESRQELEMFHLWSLLTHFTADMFSALTMNEVMELLKKVRSDSDIPFPMKVIYLMEKASRYKQLGDLAAALTIYSAISESRIIPFVVAAFYRTLYMLKKRTGTQESIARGVDRLLKALEKDAQTIKSHELYKCKAQILIDRGGIDEGIDNLQQAHQMAPDDGSVVALTAKLYQHKSEPDRALALLDNHLSKYPDSEEVWYTKGVVLANGKDFSGALECFEKACSFQPNNMEFLLMKAGMMSLDERLQEGTDLIEKRMEKEKAGDTEWRQVGMFYSNRNILDLAEFAFQKAIDLNPNEANYIHDLCLVYRKKGDLEKTILFAESNLAKYKSSDRVFRILADMHLEKGEYDEAEEYARKAIKVTPKGGALHIMLGDILARKESLGAAKTEFEKAIEINPNNIDNRVRLGRVYLYHREFDKAKEQFEAALNIYPSYKPALAGLRVIEALDKKIPIEKWIEVLGGQIEQMLEPDSATEDNVGIRLNLADDFDNDET